MSPGTLQAVGVLAATTASGYCLARFLGGELTKRERFAWSMAAGTMLLAAVSAGLMAVGLVPGPKKFAAVLLAVATLSILARRPGGGRRSRRPERSAVLPVVLVTASLAPVLLFAVVAAKSGMWATDHLAIWGLKARTIFLTGSIPPRLFHDPALDTSNPAYPLLVPLALSSAAAALRTWDPQALALFYPFFALATLLVVSGFLARRASAWAGAFGAVLVGFCAPLYSRGNVGTAEIPMALGFTLAASAFCDVLERETPQAVLRLFVGALFAAAVKPEGALFALLLAMALLVRRGSGGRAWRAVLVLLLAVFGLALLMRLGRGPLSDRHVDWSVLSAHRIGELPGRVRDVVLQIAGVEAPSAVWVLVAIALVLLATQPSFADPLIAVLVAQLTAYAAVCALSAFSPVWQVESAFSRLGWALFPTCALVACARVFAGREERRAAAPAALVGALILVLVAVPPLLQRLVGEKTMAGFGAVARPTFHASIEPILQARCQSCHHAGGIAPFALTSYADAAEHAGQIEAQVMTRRMPPWKVRDGCATFSKDPSLPEAEIATIARWVDAGAPEGRSSDAPPAKTFEDGWELGEPDVVLKAPVFTPDFSKGDVYQCFVLPTNLDENRWVSAIEVKPGNRAMVHHALLYVEEGNVSKTLDEEAPGPGYPCFGGPRAPVTDSFGEWAPGMQTRHYPDGTARFLPRKARLIAQVHYSALFGSVEPDASEVGLYFAKAPVKRRVLTDAVRADAPFTIPAGSTSHTLTGKLGPLASRSELVAILPHMHLLGRTMKVVARFPDGSRHCLVDVTDWDLRWQRTYYYEKPVVLPAGTMIELTATFDNSYANPNNPTEPPVDVHLGEHTTDEMCMALLFWTVDGKNPGERDAFFRGDVCAPGQSVAAGAVRRTDR